MTTTRWFASARALALAASLVAAALPAGAVTLKALAASGATLSFGDLVFAHFGIEPVPLTSPQGALVNDGADIDVSTFARNGQVGLHLLHVDPVTGAASTLTVDLSTNGEKNFLRNIRYDVTVADPSLRIHAVAEAFGPGSQARLEVSGFAGTYVFEPGTAGATLLDSAQLTDPLLAPGGVFNAPSLPGGDVAALGVDTAWALTTGHARGTKPVGSASIDFIDVGYTLVPSSVPEPPVWLLGLAGALAIGRRLRGTRAG